MRSWFAPRLPAAAALPSLAGPQDAWTIDPSASAHHLQRSQVGLDRERPLPDLDGRDRARSRLARRRAHRHQDRHAAGLGQQPRRRFADEGRRTSSTSRSSPRRASSSTSISGSGDRYEARGKLTLRDVTRDAVLPFTLAIVDDPAQPGRQRATARGRLIIKRLDYGVGQNEWAGTGQVANEVTIDLNVVAGRAK